MDDNSIITLFNQRSDQAIAASAEKYGAYCTTIARNILYSHEDAEECVNDTWLKAWNAIPPTIPRVLRAFFGKITRNLALHRYEAQNAQKRGGGETALAYDELSECVSDPTAAQWSAEGTVLTDTLNDFLQGMPAERRIMFVKRYWYMEPIATIATEMNCGESKVKMTLSRARAELADRLKKEGIAL